MEVLCGTRFPLRHNKPKAGWVKLRACHPERHPEFISGSGPHKNNLSIMKEFISIFSSAYAESPKATNATVAEVVGTFLLMAAGFILFIYLFA